MLRNCQEKTCGTRAGKGIESASLLVDCSNLKRPGIISRRTQRTRAGEQKIILTHVTQSAPAKAPTPLFEVACITNEEG